MQAQGDGADMLENCPYLTTRKLPPEFPTREVTQEYTVRRLSLPTWSTGAKIFLMPRALCDDPFLRSDLERYPAARCAVFDAERLISWRHGRQI